MEHPNTLLEAMDHLGHSKKNSDGSRHDICPAKNRSHRIGVGEVVRERRE